MDLVRKKFEITCFDQLTDLLKGWEIKPVQLSSGPLNLQAETVTSSRLRNDITSSACSY